MSTWGRSSPGTICEHGSSQLHVCLLIDFSTITDTFKTPGKLRGKTPRTARKRNVLGERAVSPTLSSTIMNTANDLQPLTDIFAPNTQASASPMKTQFYKQVAQIQLQQDENSDENRPATAPSLAKQAPARSKENWDSGYHGITDDEMDVDRMQSQASTATKEIEVDEAIPEESAVPAPAVVEERRTTNETFVSAREDASRKGSKEYSREVSTVPDEPVAEDEPVEEQQAPVVDVIPATQQTADEDLDQMDVDEPRSPSDASSPAKPLLRKSSFTFSSLPTREPLAQKKSIGARSSVLNQTRSSFLGRFTGGKSIGGQTATAHAGEDEDMADADAPLRPTLGREESETTKNHNHSTTEELRNRINMLGQSRDMRTSKSIPNLNASTNKPLYPQLGQAQLDKSEGETARPTTAPAPPIKQVMPGALEEDDEDDWIAPIPAAAQKEVARPAMSRTQTTESVERSALAPNETLAAQESPQRRAASPSRPKLPFGHKKAVSSSAITSPTKSGMAAHQKAISVSNPSVPSGNESTTPVGSPKRGHLDGAVSATKAKLYSAFRSAKGIFASSAGVSAQAKMEQLSPGPKARQDDGYFAGAEVQYPSIPQSRVTSAETAVSSTTQESRRTRSSTEKEHKRKEQESKQMQKMEDELNKIREKERQKAAAAAQKLQKSPSKETIASHRSGAPSRAESERSKATDDAESADEMPPPPPPKSMLPTGQAQRLREPRRIAKPTKEAAPKAKPAPVTIRMHVPSQLGHRPQPGPSTASLSQSLQDSLPPPPPPKPTLASKASTTSLHTSQSNGTLRGGNPSATAKKALDAAAKKKEADAKAAQRKAERQRELEQRRQAKQDEERRRQEEERRKQEEEKRRVDEERRAEQRRRQAEMQRREEAKRQAERQATEQRRLEQERMEQQRLEQQRLQQQRLDQQRLEQQRAQQESLAHALRQEKAQASNHPRSDLGAARPMSRMMHHDGRPAVQVNPAKPKRALAEDDDQPQRPGIQRNPPSYQQHDNKRRKTLEDEEEPMDQRRSVMAGPPVRQSNIRKENKFPHGYNTAPPPGQHAQSMLIKTVTGQHQLVHGGKPNEMSHFANGRIPFANAANPPGPSSTAQPFKTPGRPIPGHHAQKSAAKSSPHYPNPESINLPEIATDSEDEDSENEFQAPSWTESPALRELLTNQQLVDPMQVFGPIAPLRMEEVFRNKERQKKFRDRTSSAQWHADRLTEEERRKDQEARERLMRDGGWTFGTGS